MASEPDEPDLEGDGEPTELDKLLSILDGYCLQAMGFFDSVQIIATRHDADSTDLIHCGRGNLYSRTGAVKEWISDMDTLNRLMTREGHRGG